MEVLDRMTIPATKLLTVPEVARWLAVSPSWVRDHAMGRRRPVLPSYQARQVAALRSCRRGGMAPSSP